jgi:hypothetical protein
LRDFEALQRDFDLEALHFDFERLRLLLPHDGLAGLQLERPEPPAP